MPDNATEDVAEHSLGCNHQSICMPQLQPLCSAVLVPNVHVGKARHLFVIRYSLLGIPWWLYTQNIQLINHFDFFSWNVYRRGYSSILNQKKIYIMIAKSGNDDGVGAYHADTIAQ